MKAILILGSGFTGEALFRFILKESKHLQIFQTNRSGSSDFLFDLEKTETWKELPKVDGTFWLFPAEPSSIVRTFLDSYLQQIGKIVVVGSTGQIQTHIEDEVVDETSALETEIERVKGEEEIRSRGGVVVRAAGIYGPRRSPLKWLESGKISSLHKFLNVIHVDDLAQILWKAMISNGSGINYLASDSNPFRWTELAEVWRTEFQLKIPQTLDSTRSKQISKKVDSQNTLKSLKIQLQYRNVLEGVRKIETD